MKTRTTLILLGVFAALLIYVYFGEVRNPAPAATTPTPAPLWTLNQDDVVGLQVTSGDQETRLSRGTDGAWTLEAPVSDAADESRVSQVLSQLATIIPTRVFTDTAGSLDDYGLTQPDLVVTLQTADGQSETLRVGAATPQGSAYYVQAGGSDPVYLISDWIVTSLQDLLSQPPVQPTATPPPTETPASAEAPVALVPAATETPAATQAPATGTPLVTETPAN